MKDMPWRKRWRWVFLALSFLALGWTAALLWQAWPGLQVHLPQLRKRWLWASLGCMLLSGYLGFESFRIIVLRLKPALYGRLHLAHLYFFAQSMKHLPGRVWGVAYQSMVGGDASPAEWIGANVLYMFFSTGFAIWVATLLLACMHGLLSGAAVALAGLAIYAFGWNPRPLGALLDLLRTFPWRAIDRLCDAVQPMLAANRVFKLQLLLLFALSWLCYLSAWAALGTAWPGLDADDGILLCAYYTIAWAVGYLSVVTPSGLGVRELVFTLLAQRFPADAIAAMAVFGRAGLLIVDVVFAILFAPFRGEKRA
ncbi:MAG: hypothetical protein P4L92_08045 [Rudaea sp.]|nr:hypothetical protein [Rudaea sp.]